MTHRIAFYVLCTFLAFAMAMPSLARAEPPDLVVEKLEILGTRIYWGSYSTAVIGPGQSAWVLPGETVTLRVTVKNAGGSAGVAGSVKLQALLHFQPPAGWLPKHVYKPVPFGKPVIIKIPEPGKTRTVALNFPVVGSLDDGLYRVGVGVQRMIREAVRQDIFKDGPAGDHVWFMPHRPHLRIKEIRFRTISSGTIWQIYSARVLVRNEGTEPSWPAKLGIGIGNKCQTDHTILVPNLKPGEERWLREEFGNDPVFWKCTPQSIVVALNHAADGTQSGGSGDGLSTGPLLLFGYDEEKAFNATPPPSPIGKPPAQEGRLTVLVPGEHAIGSGKDEIVYRPHGPMRVLVEGAPPQLACCTVAFERFDSGKDDWTAFGGKEFVAKAGPPKGNDVWPATAAMKPGKYRLRAEAAKLKSDWIEFSVSEP